MKNLQELLHGVDVLRIVGAADVAVTDVVADSRRAGTGALFVALHGVAVDSHRFIPDVIAAGATVVVCEQLPEQQSPAVTYVIVSNGNGALARIAHNWHGRPSERLTLVGVTGTNGKTTIATLLYNLMRRLGHSVGLLSTVRNLIDDEVIESTHTTPDPLSLNALLARMVDHGCTHVFMEVSSHSCAQHRIDGLQFNGGVFTNLTRDHLDFHKTVDEYIKAKKRFFDMLPAGSFALVNADDKVGAVMLQNTAARRLTYALRTVSDYHATLIENRLDGMTLRLDNIEVDVQLTGRFNAYNLLAVYATARLLGVEAHEAAVKISELRPVDGRMQTVRSPRGIVAIVDYAHTPDALVNVLDTIRDTAEGARGNIITVCGCGGNRDKGKRPIMAAEAARRSDRLILTSDNPRDEEPDAILADMLEGLSDEQRATTLVITDRAQAIGAACALARPGDVILVAGKGHETYQEVRGVKHHFDDREQLAGYLKS